MRNTVEWNASPAEWSVATRLPVANAQSTCRRVSLPETLELRLRPFYLIEREAPI